MKRQLTLVPHRHRVATARGGLLATLDGPGETVDLELCACTAWRRAGNRMWHGTRFRRQLPVVGLTAGVAR